MTATGRHRTRSRVERSVRNRERRAHAGLSRARFQQRSIPWGLLRSFLACLGLLGLASAGRAGSYKVIAVSNGGTIEGVVKLAGTAPALGSLQITKNEDYCGASLPNPLYDVGHDSGLKNAQVFLKSIARGKENPGGTIVLENVHCTFVPRVQGASVGQRIRIASSDLILHTTHPQIAATNATLYNIALPYKGFSLTRPLPSTPQLLRVKCDAHEWMRAWIWEFDHPYYATTDDSGRFKITDVPPGTYTVVAWHEVMGEREAEVTIAPGRPSTLEFSFTPKP
jgi:hypothetical protein